SLASSRLSRISVIIWLLFWAMTLTMVQRNVVYRFLTNDISNRNILHQIFPEKFDSSTCIICNDAPKSTFHMLFFCPIKYSAWQAIILEFLWPTYTVQNNLTALQKLDFNLVSHSHKDGIKSSMVILITLSQIWKSHFRSIFDGLPF
ncbi:uncharacterized protein EV154DRAFT_391900, partial [Mucor mucedo]|uniref:uncharacterized protein n=1 Tax=Mucor mucedo TaxID=29922 RepID=UPI00221F29A0